MHRSKIKKGQNKKTVITNKYNSNEKDNNKLRNHDNKLDKPRNISEGEFQVRKLLYSNLDSFGYHQWPREDLRWAELISSLLSRINYSNDQETLREMIAIMGELDLLNVQRLAEMKKTNGRRVDMNEEDAKRIYEVMSDYGFTNEESEMSILVMHEAAKGLTEHHGGKIQKYLRKYGQNMLNDITRNFSFSSLSKEDVSYAFTLWLQNVLNMPVTLRSEGMKRFCDRLGLKPGELVEQADKVDVNLAVVDDIIYNWYQLQKQEAEGVIESKE